MASWHSHNMLSLFSHEHVAQLHAIIVVVLLAHSSHRATHQRQAL
jgi:hypothetical protein